MKTMFSRCNAGVCQLLIAILLCSFGWAQSPSSIDETAVGKADRPLIQEADAAAPNAKSAQSSPELELRKLEDDWAAAVSTNDPDRIGRFFPEKFMFVGAGGVLQNRDEHLEDFRSGRLRIESVHIEYFVADVRQEFAVVNVLAVVTGQFAERDISGTYRFMDTLSKKSNSWHAVARQQTRVAVSSARPLEGSDANSRSNRSLEQRPDVVPTIVLQAPRDELPSQRLLRQKYLEDNPLPPRRPDSPLHPDSRLTKPTTTSAQAACPVEVRSSGGRLDVTLDVEYHTATIGRDQVRLRMYNKCLVGPTLRVKAGDVIHITLNNRLPVESSTPHAANGHHAWNTTNLHFHGLHVSPQGPAGVPDEESDNVLLALPPSNPFDPTISTQKYRVQVPASHVAGTFWYHAHKHGSTTAQVSSGMAGALIVERDDAVHNLDSVPEVAAAKEEIMLLQEIPYLKDPSAPLGEIERSPITAPDPNLNDVLMFGPSSFRDLRRYITVNGEKIPTIVMAPGEIRRLRIIYSGQRENVRLRVERDPSTTSGPEYLTLYEIAVDGLPTGSIRATDRARPEPRDRVLELYPGYRSDVLLQAPNEASDFYLVDTRYDGATPRPDTGADGSPELLRWVARIRVEGPPVSMALPSTPALARHRLTDLSVADATGTQFAFYGLELTLSPIGFFVSRDDLATNLSPVSMTNAESYNPLNPRVLPMNATERWLVGSRNAGAAVVHPFHIHTNPFLITKVTSLVEPGSTGVPVDVTTREIGEPTWRDTLAMKHGFTYELLTRYDDFTGDFVDHCHILDHEDNGMMELVRIAAPFAPPVSATVASASPKRIARSIPEANLEPSVLFFVKGSACPHCMSQLIEMASKLNDEVSVTVVSASTEDDLQNFPVVPFTLVADPEFKLFREYEAFDGEPKHATIVRNREGTELFRKIGDEPMMNSDEIFRALAQTATNYVISVRNSISEVDDYINWAPTECTIHIENGVAGSDPVTVVLTNADPVENPDAGELGFDTTLAPRSTASSPTLSLSVPSDGSKVPFYIAGIKASTLTPTSLANKGRDTKIVIHQGTATGAVLGEKAVMVRVRKALRHSSDPRPKLTALELEEFLKALRDLHFVENRLEWYVRMHRLATDRGAMAHPGFNDPPDPRWRDQAHKGSGFLAWHRAFLLQFERELQIRYPHVALPYWVQGTDQDFFTSDQFGSFAESDNVVQFTPGSPLYGWSISLTMDRGGATNPMGLLRRNPADHNDPATPAFPYRQWSDFSTSTLFTQIRNVESNPHNNGHGAVGPAGEWMSNCRESNADPVFYVFHCNHDYLWAKWQYEKDRYKNDGSDVAHYFPNDRFTDAGANKNIPLGHHLGDSMWPWDGTTNQVVAGEINSNRPNVNDFGPFPTSSLPLLWPPGEAQPSPTHMIDYQGVEARSNDLGFCYDDVPFGSRPSIGPVMAARTDEVELDKLRSAALATAANRSASPDARLLALQALSPRQEPLEAESLKALANIVSSRVETPDLRSAALRRLFNSSPTDAFRASIGVIADNDAPISFRLAAIDEANKQVHFSEVPHEVSHQIIDSLRRVLREGAPPAIRAAAARKLAPIGDPLAKAELLKSLDGISMSALPPVDSVSLLRFFPEEKERLREFVLSENDAIVVAAIQALYRDPETIAHRRSLAQDTQKSLKIRQAAIQSLIHEEDPELTEFLLRLAADPQTDLELRGEALASATVRLRKAAKKLTAAESEKWRVLIQTVPAAETTPLGRIRQDSLSIVAPR